MAERFNSNLTHFIETEISVLKLEIKELELEINTLDNEKAEIEKLIHEFEIKHTKELGEIILEILRLRKEKLEKEVKLNEKKQDEFYEAKRDYDDFQYTYETTKEEKIFDLTPEEKQKLKSKYRKASKLCHPDIVSDDLKEKAEQIFKDLKKAYEQNDLNKVNEILENLEKGIFISKSDSINEKENLKNILNGLIIKRDNLIKIIDNIKNTNTYKIIIKIPNWDKYFSETKEQLEKELCKLQINE